MSGHGGYTLIGGGATVCRAVPVGATRFIQSGDCATLVHARLCGTIGALFACIIGAGERTDALGVARSVGTVGVESAIRTWAT